MPDAKLNTAGTLNAMKSEEGNDSIDTFIRQTTTGKEPFLSFSRLGESPVQWIQLLHALDQPDLPGWPLLTPLKVQMQKCEKCSREFFSLINYRRHIRVHRRSLNVDKESHKHRDLLAAFWDKLSVEQAKEILVLKDVSIKDRPWSEPDQFIPERFLTSHAEVDYLGQHFEFTPFGSGRRCCPGITFAMQVTHLTLAQLLQGFDFTTPLNMPVDMTEGQSLTLPKAKPLQLVVTARLPSGFYLN
ncbi:unnamed protein product [Fraxinus pennsylvanica]|uniref:C2H2-type domain-containing protein n=1 Tax=Fraxinus pennsylvanica TaxID=56036 RepID=A0AAD1ZZS5_9LAMI|nr:unnamed protein product [Fraxinus pennsylvanica]